MNPKDKAKELVEKYSFVEIANYTSIFEVKQCALIAVDESMLMLPYTDINTTLGKFCIKQHEYLEQVKQEIKKL